MSLGLCEFSYNFLFQTSVEASIITARKLYKLYVFSQSISVGVVGCQKSHGVNSSHSRCCRFWYKSCCTTINLAARHPVGTDRHSGPSVLSKASKAFRKKLNFHIYPTTTQAQDLLQNFLCLLFECFAILFQPIKIFLLMYQQYIPSTALIKYL